MSFETPQAPKRESIREVKGNPFESTLHKTFRELDQDQMRANQYDYYGNDELGEIKNELESVPDSDLDRKQIELKNNILWMWYHHASQFAFRDGEKELAISHINEALAYQDKVGDHPNQITQLLKYIYEEDETAARTHLQTIESEVEQKTGYQLIKDFLSKK
tara:strand:+ start:99 stop:584 length:486 start_codon:yes stop_codon:yes gene_type:complete